MVPEPSFIPLALVAAIMVAALLSLAACTSPKITGNDHLSFNICVVKDSCQ